MKKLMDDLQGREELRVEEPFFDLDLFYNKLMGTYDPSEPKWKKSRGFSPTRWKADYGKCERFWYYALNSGYIHVDNITPETQDKFSEGHAWHDRFTRRLERAGLVHSADVPITCDDPPVYGEADGIGNCGGLEYVLELKTIYSEGYYRVKGLNKPYKKHQFQIMMYMYVLDIDWGLVIYSNKDTHKRLPFVIYMGEDERAYMDKEFDKMRKMHELVMSLDAPPEPRYKKDGTQCRWCPAKEYCWGDIDIAEVRK